RRRMTNDWNFYSDVSVSADGSTIAAVRTVYLGNLWVVETSSRKARQLTFNSNPENTVTGNSWKRVEHAIGVQSQSVVFTARRQWLRQLFRINLDGRPEFQLTSGAYQNSNPHCLPGGGIVFEKYGDDNVAHLWSAQADGSDSRQLTGGNLSESIQDVSGDGRTVLYSL